ncbi:MAG: polyphosphate polymerase domain-containing protein [Lachnospiraceae bacterium]|nr:polyphosphate polymerase domain-containing protein [Lachnospiraceae bacterium]MBQ7507226.1 polyphosphate polymerase domain-containing protein [Lachnospiraceae bacterium]
MRHEIKHRISRLDMLCIRQRLLAIAESDSHATNGRYRIRSLYFDTPDDRALKEKIDGVDRREKFRIRYYDDDLSFIRLEKKSKQNGLGTKDNARLSAEEAQRIVDGDLLWMEESDQPLIRELFIKMKDQLLRPKTIVDYEREPFTYPPGNVRVTLDFNIRTGLMCTDFLNRDVPTVPVNEDPIILEVKWDEYLPEIIRYAVQTNVRECAYSKYAECRMFD